LGTSRGHDKLMKRSFVEDGSPSSHYIRGNKIKGTKGSSKYVTRTRITFDVSAGLKKKLRLYFVQYDRTVQRH
jgi:hypothetical protein